MDLLALLSHPEFALRHRLHQPTLSLDGTAHVQILFDLVSISSVQSKIKGHNQQRPAKDTQAQPTLGKDPPELQWHCLQHLRSWRGSRHAA